MNNFVFLNIVFLNIVFLNIVYTFNSSCTRFNPSCTTCKFFIPKIINKDLHDNTLGLCEIFKENINGKLVKNLAIHCRNNESLCGKSGTFYKPNDHINLNEELKMLKKTQKHNTKTKYISDKNLRNLFM